MYTRLGGQRPAGAKSGRRCRAIGAGDGADGRRLRTRSSNKENTMSERLDNPLTQADPLLRGVLITSLAIAAIGMLLLVRATFGGGVDHVTVRVDNQAALVLQLDTIDASGARVGLGIAAPKTRTTFQEIPDIGPNWTFVAAYAGRQVHRVAMTKAELAAQGWTVSIPATAATELEEAGFR
jgi:hypothetical protein